MAASALRKGWVTHWLPVIKLTWAKALTRLTADLYVQAYLGQAHLRQIWGMYAQAHVGNICVTADLHVQAHLGNEVLQAGPLTSQGVTSVSQAFGTHQQQRQGMQGPETCVWSNHRMLQEILRRESSVSVLPATLSAILKKKSDFVAEMKQQTELTTFITYT
eukprot:1158330-Pelagomonas_calceolata.AAC.11